MQIEKAIGASYAATRQNPNAWLREMGREEVRRKKTTLTLEAPESSGRLTNRRKPMRPPGVSQRCKSGQGLVRLTPLRESPKMSVCTSRDKE